jgi:hypothetical protein
VITYKLHLENVDWEEMKATLSQDNFDNGRTPEQLKISFTNSYRTCIAYAGDVIDKPLRVYASLAQLVYYRMVFVMLTSLMSGHSLLTVAKELLVQ